MQAVGKYTAAIDLHPTAIYLSNRAFCYVKLEQFGLAILDADLALTCVRHETLRHQTADIRQQ